MIDNNIMFIPQGVSEEFAEASGLAFGYVTEDVVRELLQPRRDDAHKGTYGHALLVCGSKGMIGAASLSTGAALRSGCGLVTIHLPESERFPVEANFPSALFSLDNDMCFSELPENLEKYSAVGVGCGLGTRGQTVAALKELLKFCYSESIKTVIDADAINIIAANPDILDIIPQGAILTSHIGELRRLVGEWSSEEDKIDRIVKLAKELRCVVIVKGPNTLICDAGKTLAFNSTGNSGMAKGGCGDVLTGYITGLLARGYESYEAALLGVYIHGAAGDRTCDYFGTEGMNSADVVDFLGEVMKEME